jgi:ankyrin repeat protein
MNKLMYTVLNEDVEYVREFIHSMSRMEINQINNAGYTALMFSCELRTDKGREIVKLLLGHPHINVNFQSSKSDRNTALISACKYSAHENIKLLLNHPLINVNLLDMNGYTPLMYAIKDCETIKLLLSHPEISVNEKDFEGNTALMLACSLDWNALEIIKLLLDHPKIDICLKNKKGKTAYDIAMENPGFEKYKSKIIELFNK